MDGEEVTEAVTGLAFGDEEGELNELDEDVDEDGDEEERLDEIEELAASMLVI